MSKLNSQWYCKNLTDDLANNKLRTQQWVEANAKAKSQKYSMPTRFRKPGPINEEDWTRFNKWLNKTMTKKPLLNDQVIKSTKKPSQRKPLQKRLNELALPKNKREKYDLSASQMYTFSPTTNCCSKKPLVNRFSKHLKVPKWWYHEESEMSFWRDMRFPISYKTLQYKISNRIENLAKPKQFPIKSHCYIPQPVVFEPVERVKMTQQQWMEHKKRLEYLSDSNFKNTRVEKVLNKMKSEPKNKVKHSTLSYGLRLHAYANDFEEI